MPKQTDPSIAPSTTPAPDDVAGWCHVLSDDPEHEGARGALNELVEKARSEGQPERGAEVLLSQAEVLPAGPHRAQVLSALASVYERDLADPDRALPAAVAAFGQKPDDSDALDTATRLAEARGDWNDLVAELGRAADEAPNAAFAAALCCRLGRLYLERLAHAPYAELSYKRALAKVPNHKEAVEALIDLYRRQERWAEVADFSEKRLEALDAAERADELLALGDLYESQLGAPKKAVVAWQRAAESREHEEDALAGLARLHQQREEWEALHEVLGRRAERCLQEQNPVRAATFMRQRAEVAQRHLADKAMAMYDYERAVEADPKDRETLQALVDVCEAYGAHEKYYRALETLAGQVSKTERAGVLRRLAFELEEVPEERGRAIQHYQSLLELDEQADDVRRSLVSLLLREERYADAEPVLRARADAADGAQRVALYVDLAVLLQDKLGRSGDALSAYEQALSSGALTQDVLRRVIQLAKQENRHGVSLVAQVQLAETTGDASAWTGAGDVARERGELDDAKTYYQRALDIDPKEQGALVGLSKAVAKNDAADHLVRAAEAAQERAERADLLIQAAGLSQVDPDRECALLLQALEADPGRRDARARLLEVLEGLGREAELHWHAEALLPQETDPVHKARWHVLAGRGLSAEGDVAAAAGQFALATQATPSDADAWERWTAALTTVARGGQSSRQQWQAVVDACTAAYAALGQGVRARFSEREAYARLHAGDAAGAAEAYAVAWADRPDDKELSDALLDACGRAQNWSLLLSSAESRAQHLASLPDTEAERCRLHVLVGDTHKDKLAAPEAALACYEQALALAPESPRLLHKVLDVHTDGGHWTEVVKTLDRIAAVTSDVQRRAKYLRAAAVVARDELSDREAADARFLAAAKDDPSDDAVLREVEGALRRAERYQELAALYRQSIKSQGDNGPEDVALSLWARLGDLCHGPLGDTESAIAAYEVVTSLDPSDLVRREALMELYLAGDGRRSDALEELHLLLAAQPERVPLYRLMADLYAQEGDKDAAYCLAQTLSFLSAADDSDEARLAEVEGAGLRPATSRMGAEQWASLRHSHEDRYLAVAMAKVMDVLAPAAAQPPEAFGLDKLTPVDVDSDHRAPARVFQYVTDILQLPVTPTLYLDEEADGVRVANVRHGSTYHPAVVLGLPYSASMDEQELAFEIARAMAYFHADRAAFLAFPTAALLEEAVSGLRQAVSEPSGGNEWARAVRTGASPAVLEEIRAILAESDAEDRAALAAWRDAAELSANRLGLVIAGELRGAVEAVARHEGALSTLPTQERLVDLLAFSASEAYLALRRHLGVALS